MAKSASVNPLVDEFVTFIQNALPGFTDGEYQLNISQKVNDSGGNPISDDSLKQSYQFAVLGDRFQLSNPPRDLYSVFPADQSSGKFSNVLPHVVLTKEKLPWSRYPTIDEPTPSKAKDIPTWLTVLLFDEDDLAEFPGLTLTPQSSTIGDLFPPAAYKASTLGKNHSYFDGATDTSLLEPGQTPSDTIHTIDIPLKLFWKVAPTVPDLCLMAHVRKVSFEPKPTIPGVSDVGEPVGTFSIVFGNRLPQTQKKTQAFLVSLEAMEPLLPSDENGGQPTSNTFDGSQSVRLAVLRNWSFYSTGQSATFVDQALALNDRTAGNSPPSAENTNLRLPYSGTNKTVKDALSMGYSPLNTNLRTGEKTISWYRGPLPPYKIEERSIKMPIASADQATVFDPTTGMLDVSYATAWSLGRLIALQDKAFSSPLYSWKKGLCQDAVNEIEQQILHQTFSKVLQAATTKSTGTKSAGEKSDETKVSSKNLLHQMMNSLR